MSSRTSPFNKPSSTSPAVSVRTAASCGSFQWRPGCEWSSAACCAANTRLFLARCAGVLWLFVGLVCVLLVVLLCFSVLVSSCSLLLLCCGCLFLVFCLLLVL